MWKRVLGGGSLVIVIMTSLLFFIAPKKIGIGQEGKVKEAETTNTSNDQDTKKTDKQKKSDPNLPKVDQSDWELLLVNGDRPFSGDEPELIAMKNGYLIDERVYQAYYAMEEDAAAAGYALTVISAYRSVASQQEVYDQSVQENLALGLSEAEAVMKTEEYITVPGTSEHHTGLAIDVVDVDWYNAGKGLETEFATTKAAKWLAQYGPQYGFIIRYLEGKDKLTGIKYEPWHLRYVGQESAMYIQEHNLVLEEYLELLKEAGQ